MKYKQRLLTTALMTLCMFALLPAANVALAAGSEKVESPDFTRGDKIPEGWTHDWTLGPTGLRGWIYSDTGVTTDARQIKITKVEKGSPSDGVLEVGDVILGVNGKPFDDDARMLFGKAITAAEKKKNRGNLRLICWRNEKTENVTLKLQPLGTYSPTAPFDCPKSKRIIRLGCQALAKQMIENPTQGHIITRALNATALLASGNPEYLPVVREQARLLSQYDQSSGVRTWQYGYVNIFLAEYVLATGDRTYVDQGLKRITKMIVDGQSYVGSWGHAFVQEKTKRLRGYGMMNAPGIPLTYSLVLARRAGLSYPELDAAIRKSEVFLQFYVGKGAIPYGDHNPWIETHEDNGKCGMAAVLFDHQDNAKAAEYYSRMSVASHGAERDTGHTGNFFNMTWALPGVTRSGPQASGAWMQEFGWHYDLARRWDGTFRYQGAPTQRPESYHNWDCTGAYLIGYGQALRKTYLTGRKPSTAPAINRATAKSLLDDGRGWSNKDRNSYYDSLSTKQLLERLSSWSPTVRERSAMALGRRKDDVITQLIDLLEAPDLYTRYGACQAIKIQRGRGAATVPALLQAFRSDDLWLRILAAEALAGIGKPAKAAVPEMLVRLTKSDPENDPRNMEQRYLSFALFNTRGGLIGQSLEGVDRTLLIKAVRNGLQNEDGRARGAYGSVYRNLTFEEIQPLLPAIHKAIVEPAPSGIMFADGIRVEGLRLLSKHLVNEGIEACVKYTQAQNPWASEKRTLELMKLLLRYGTHAKSAIPELKLLADTFAKGEKDFPRRLSLQKAQAVRETIRAIKASTDEPKLIYLNQ
jgi:hypothetical protein